MRITAEAEGQESRLTERQKNGETNMTEGQKLRGTAKAQSAETEDHRNKRGERNSAKQKRRRDRN